MNRLSSNARQHDENIQSLFRMPGQYEEFCQAAVNAGLARDTQEYWKACLDQEGDQLPSGSHFLERLIALVIRAYPPSKDDDRSDQVRLRGALNAILGRSRYDASNTVDDDEVLRELAWQASDHNFDERKLREITRTLISGRNFGGGTEESAVRRIVNKFKTDQETVRRALSSEDLFRDDLHAMVLRDILQLLASVGVKSAFARAIPSPALVNVESTPSSYSDFDEEVP